MCNAMNMSIMYHTCTCIRVPMSCLFHFTGTFPIDTTKTRLQIQGQTIDTRLTELKYRGMTHALSRILREEGPNGLYSG